MLPRTENKRQWQSSLICGRWNIWAENRMWKMFKWSVNMLPIGMLNSFGFFSLCIFPVAGVSTRHNPGTENIQNDFLFIGCCRKRQNCALKALRLHIINSIVYLTFAFNLIIATIMIFVVLCVPLIRNFVHFSSVGHCLWLLLFDKFFNHINYSRSN